MTLDWQGLPASRFYKYKSWKNKHKPGICGTYVVAAMLHDFLLHEYGLTYRQDQLIQAVKVLVDDGFPYRGTFFWDLQRGLNFFLKDLGYQAKSHLFPDLKVPEVLSSQCARPLAVGTASILGSPYKNHWLLAYAYAYDDQGQLFFKCYDNHGRHDAVILASKSLACCWIEGL